MLRVFSTFSGISAASIAWKPLGFTFIGYAEIEPFACHVLSKRLGVSKPKYLPEMTTRQLKDFDGLPEHGIPNFGDITQISDDDLRILGRVDVLEGGSPCQSFSVAGLREGLNDERGNLMLEFCKLAERMRRINGLRYVVWENVKGVLHNEKGAAFGSLLGALLKADRRIQPPRRSWRNSGFSNRLDERRAVSWRVLDAKFFGVAQRRERIFVVADFDDRQGDSGVILFERKSENRFAETKRETGTNTVAGAEESSRNIGANNDNIVHHPPVVGTLMASAAGLNRAAGMGSELDFVVVQEFDGELIARRLHPIECERLQGFPDGWTDVPFNRAKTRSNHDTLRYRTLGNSMATPCMKFIGIGLLQYHREQMKVAA